MSKIDPVSTAFAIVHTDKAVRQLEDKVNEALEDVRLIEGPKGDRGDRGPQGARGEKGDKGDKGEKGIAGAKGESGDIGATGPMGETGARGESGEEGPTGPTGPQGVKGDKGEAGSTGPQGEVGPQGQQGEKGDRGETGAVGADGAQGRDGAKGDTGAQGPAGKQGEKGERGEQGLKGDQGQKGEKGEAGPQGDAGKDAEDYTEKFEEALSKFNERLTENASRVDGNIQKQIDRINNSLSTLGGGGSYKLVDNADVDKSAIKGLADDAVLIYDQSKKKFVAQSFLSIIDRLKADLEVQYDKLVDEDATNSFTYVGEASPGTDKDQNTWRIKRIYELSDGDLEILWANGTATFDKIWNDRATYTYSAD